MISVHLQCLQQKGALDFDDGDGTVVRQQLRGNVSVATRLLLIDQNDAKSILFDRLFALRSNHTTITQFQVHL
ncbi:hypothetical protein AAHA92_26306 [Salvia divinorum]|uniref:Uncharacterized protein n=1 Tax=Salvia divinorum TaxID=28513 RepID=A0ABD1GDR7_SALDI